MIYSFDCPEGFPFLGAVPPTNQRFDLTITFVEALVDFPDQLIPQESQPSGQPFIKYSKTDCKFMQPSI
ncbi:TPA: hypothetical protein R1908_000611 [Staphylococcus delphini]|nr:hypothetical protein [Staphylococcus delphini]